MNNIERCIHFCKGVNSKYYINIALFFEEYVDLLVDSLRVKEDNTV
jgi:hypothetical protein